MKLETLIFVLYVFDFCFCNLSPLPASTSSNLLFDAYSLNSNATLEKRKNFDLNKTQTFHLSKKRPYYEEPKTLEITVALKDESDTSMMKGDTKRVVYCATTNQYCN